MAEGRKDIVATVTADGSDDITLLACQCVGAFHQCEIAVAGDAQQLLVGAGVIGDSHNSLFQTKWPGLRSRPGRGVKSGRGLRRHAAARTSTTSAPTSSAVHFFQHGRAVSRLRQPELGCLAIRARCSNSLLSPSCWRTRTIADDGALDDLEGEITIDGVGAHEG